MTKPEFAVIGPGRVGIHLAKGLNDRGWRCVAIRGRQIPPISSRPESLLSCTWDTWHDPAQWVVPETLFVCVPDRVLNEVDRLLARHLDLSGRTVFHTSGLERATVLSACMSARAIVGSWHPLQSFPPAETQDVSWDGVLCAIEGDSAAVDSGFRLATLLGAKPWEIDPETKPLYHAAAAVIANLSHIIIAEGARLLLECGLPKSEGDNPLLPLVETSSRAALDAPDLTRLTGPLSRGDTLTVEHHFRVLPNPIQEVYRYLAQIAEKRLSGSKFV